MLTGLGCSSTKVALLVGAQLPSLPNSLCPHGALAVFRPSTFYLSAGFESTKAATPYTVTKL